MQGGGIHTWLIYRDPFAFAAFFVYFIASLASNKRAPFDLPESESELVAGFHTEYSGLRWSFFFFAEYGAMFVVGGIQAALFLGGWHDHSACSATSTGISAPPSTPAPPACFS
jgi:NADH-quinone oxidoreductase subunit H